MLLLFIRLTTQHAGNSMFSNKNIQFVGRHKRRYRVYLLPHASIDLSRLSAPRSHSMCFRQNTFSGAWQCPPSPNIGGRTRTHHSHHHKSITIRRTTSTVGGCFHGIVKVCDCVYNINISKSDGLPVACSVCMYRSFRSDSLDWMNTKTCVVIWICIRHMWVWPQRGCS